MSVQGQSRSFMVNIGTKKIFYSEVHTDICKQRVASRVFAAIGLKQTMITLLVAQHTVQVAQHSVDTGLLLLVSGSLTHVWNNCIAAVVRRQSTLRWPTLLCCTHTLCLHQRWAHYDPTVNSFYTRLLSYCTDGCMHTYDVSTYYWVSSSHATDSSSKCGVQVVLTCCACVHSLSLISATRQKPCRKRVYNGAGQPHRPVNTVYAIQRARHVSELVQQDPNGVFAIYKYLGSPTLVGMP